MLKLEGTTKEYFENGMEFVAIERHKNDVAKRKKEAQLDAKWRAYNDAVMEFLPEPLRQFYAPAYYGDMPQEPVFNGNRIELWAGDVDTPFMVFIVNMGPDYHIKEVTDIYVLVADDFLGDYARYRMNTVNFAPSKSRDEVIQTAFAYAWTNLGKHLQNLKSQQQIMATRELPPPPTPKELARRAIDNGDYQRAVAIVLAGLLEQREEERS